MQKATNETNRRRKIQFDYNRENNIDPQSIRKKVGDIIQMARAAEAGTPYKATVPNLRGRKGRDAGVPDVSELPQEDLAKLIQSLSDEMNEAAADLRFEYAARLRDEIAELKRELRGMQEALR